MLLVARGNFVFLLNFVQQLNGIDHNYEGTLFTLKLFSFFS
jgi:hypothetical protein